MKVIIVNSGGYNISSIVYALKKIDVSAVISEDANIIKKADRVILPGVGHAAKAMQKLNELNLVECIKNLTQPVMGICLGMQLLCNFSEEGNVSCLRLIEKDIIRLPNNIIIPQMGWNKIIQSGEYVYFANSYYLPVCNYTTSYVEYCNIKITATLQKNNFFGCQFHPEKSGKIGEQILRDFIYD